MQDSREAKSDCVNTAVPVFVNDVCMPEWGSGLGGDYFP